MTNERKATDILLSIEQKLEEVLSQLRNHDLLLKTLNNKISSKPFSSESLVESLVETIKEQKQIPGIKPGIKLNIPEKFNGLKSNNISVEQQIQYPDGKPIAMAKVEIFKKNGMDLELVKSIKTNPVGKWMSNLSAGEYKIAVMKSAIGNKAPVKIDYDVVIMEKEGLVKLDDYKIQ